MRECFVRLPSSLNDLLQWEHIKGFSPECFSLCLLRWLGWFDAYSHWLHRCGFSPVCFNMCLFKVPFWLAEKEHWLHEKCLSSVWMWECLVRLLFTLNDLLHCEHAKGFSPLWISKCFVKEPFAVKDLLHSGHLNLLPVWICLWFQRVLLFANILGHKSQDFSFGIMIRGANSALRLNYNNWRRKQNDKLSKLSLSPKNESWKLGPLQANLRKI